MKMFKSFTILLLLMAAVSVFGQDTSYIEVTGTAEKEVIPDEIYIAITIRERFEGKVKISIEKQELDLKDALKSIGVSIENLFLSDANADYIRVKRSKKNVISSTEYILKVGDALTVGKVFEKLDALNIYGSYIAKVNHSKILEYKKEVRIMAIKAAKEKADYLLEAIGEETGKALKVNELNQNMGYANTSLNSRSMGHSTHKEKKEGSDEVVIQFKKIKLRASIYVKFEIK